MLYTDRTAARHDLQSLFVSAAGGGWTELAIADDDLRLIGELPSLRELELVGTRISDLGFTHLSSLTLQLHKTGSIQLYGFIFT